MRLLPARREAPDLVGALMITVGSLHFVVPGMMAEQIPAWIPFRRELVYVSGVVEVACGLGLRRRDPWAAPLAAATLTAIWPANIQMAFDAGTGKNHGLMDNRRLMWARVPLQLPLIWGALRARR